MMATATTWATASRRVWWTSMIADQWKLVNTVNTAFIADGVPYDRRVDEQNRIVFFPFNLDQCSLDDEVFPSLH
jgi:hypothetical protein